MLLINYQAIHEDIFVGQRMCSSGRPLIFEDFGDSLESFMSISRDFYGYPESWKNNINYHLQRRLIIYVQHFRPTGRFLNFFDLHFFSKRLMAYEGDAISLCGDLEASGLAS